MIKSKKELRYKYEKDRRICKEEANKLEQGILSLKQTMVEEDEMQEQEIDKLGKELGKLKDIIKRKSDNNEKLKENLKQDKTLYFEKEKEYAEVERKLKIM